MIYYRTIRGMAFLVLMFTFFSFNGVNVPDVNAGEKTIKFPSKPIKIILPAAAGGALDVENRLIQSYLEKNLGVGTTIENIIGANGIIAYNKIYQEKPDGYTILGFNFISSIELELTRETAKYVVKNLSPIAGWNVKNHGFFVHPERWKTFSEFLNEARQKNLIIGATGGSAYIQAHILESALGIKFNWVPYESAAQSLTALAGKHADVVVTYPVIPKPMIRAGKLRALGVISPNRDPILPGVPTFKELGYDVPCVVVHGGYAAPPNTPKEIVAILENAVSKAVKDSEFLKGAEEVGVVVDFKPTAEANKLIQEIYEILNRYRQFIK